MASIGYGIGKVMDVHPAEALTSFATPQPSRYGARAIYHHFRIAGPRGISNIPGMQSSQKELGQLVWWIMWFGLLSSVLAIHFIIPVVPGREITPAGALTYVPLVPLFLGCAVRWLLLPRLGKQEHALAVFLMGLALCEGCAILGIFLVPEMRSTYVVLAVIGVLQFMPVFAGRFFK